MALGVPSGFGGKWRFKAVLGVGIESASRGLITGLCRRWKVEKRFKGAAEVWVGRCRSWRDYKSKWSFGSWLGESGFSVLKQVGADCGQVCGQVWG